MAGDEKWVRRALCVVVGYANSAAAVAVSGIDSMEVRKVEATDGAFLANQDAP